MRSIRRHPWIIGALLLFCLAGCGARQADVTISPGTRAAPAARTSPVEATASAMPSYPILLVDLPRYNAGQPVAPARSRVLTAADRDIDMPSIPAASPAPAPPAVSAIRPAPMLAPVMSVRPAPAPAPMAVHVPTPKKEEPVDLRYIP